MVAVQFPVATTRTTLRSIDFPVQLLLDVFVSGDGRMEFLLDT